MGLFRQPLAQSPALDEIETGAVTTDLSLLAQVAEAIGQATQRIVAAQNPAGYWCFQLEADCTIPAEYVIMMHYMDEVDEALQARIAVYLRARQGEDGGWPLFHDGKSDISCSVKVYYALKMVGDAPDRPHMARAREYILAQGGAAHANVFTRITLALFPLFRLKSFCCPAGSLFTWIKFPTGRARSLSRCLSCAA
jgi:squalene-hopene/tetraprenyl-beta-curcumene cyclase